VARWGLATGATRFWRAHADRGCARKTTVFVVAGIGFLGVAFVSGYWETERDRRSGTWDPVDRSARLKALGRAVVPGERAGRSDRLWTLRKFIAQ